MVIYNVQLATQTLAQAWPHLPLHKSLHVNRSSAAERGETSAQCDHTWVWTFPFGAWLGLPLRLINRGRIQVLKRTRMICTSHCQNHGQRQERRGEGERTRLFTAPTLTDHRTNQGCVSHSPCLPFKWSPRKEETNTKETERIHE